MNTNNTPYEDDEIEIDLLELFMALKRKFWLILLITVLGGGIAEDGLKIPVVYAILNVK